MFSFHYVSSSLWVWLVDLLEDKQCSSVGDLIARLFVANLTTSWLVVDLIWPSFDPLLWLVGKNKGFLFHFLKHTISVHSTCLSLYMWSFRYPMDRGWRDYSNATNWSSNRGRMRNICAIKEQSPVLEMSPRGVWSPCWSTRRVHHADMPI